MKKLLTTITISALVGTSVSNLKPVFTNNVVNHGLKSNKLNKDISIKNQNDKKPFDKLIIKENFLTSSIFSLSNGAVYVGTKNQSLWKSTDGIKFEQVAGLPNDEYINDTKIAPNGTIYVGTNGKGLWKSTDGLNFNQVNGIPNDYFVSSIVCSKDGKIFVGNNSSGSQKGVYKSTDGITFKKILGTSEQIQCLKIDKDDNVYAGTTNSMGDQGVIYKSDGTNDFTEITKFTGAVNNLAIDSSNNVYVGTEVYKTKQGNVYKSTDGTNFSEMSGINISISSLAIDKNDNVYAGTTKGLYKSNGANEFSKVYEVSDDDIVNSVTISKNGAVYVGTQNKGLYITNPINLLVDITKPDTFDKSWPLYNGIVYNSVQKIDIKETLVASATLDGKSITIPTTDLDIPIGEHNLILTLKDKLLVTVFGGDVTTGTVTYKLWVKTAINKNDIKYSTNKDDTELYSGLVSNAGNTNGVDIIQTKNKNISVHQATLNSKFDDILIDYPNSYYLQGTVDDATNDFTVTGSKQVVSKNLSIKTDGIYHLHLEDTVGNIYDSYLELGESNWKLKGTFNDSELDKLKAKLNVTVNITDPTQKSKALGWLHQYENFVENKFNETIKTNGKGFDSEIKNQISSYTSFLKSLTYDIANEPKFDDGLDKYLLVKTITDKAKEILNKGLDVLPKNLNVNTSNVVNKSTLEHYTNWINNYQYFINKNKDKWINEIEKIASCGFATDEQENKIKAQISQFLNNDNIKNYLKNIVWEDNKLLKATSNDYKQYIEIEKLQSDTINWVNTNMKDINIAYQQAIKNAESGLNLHGYSIDEILNGKQKPQTKNEIDNFAAGQSYHDWLQSQANIKFHGWQLTMGLSIGISLAVIFGFVALIWYWKSDKKRKPYEVKSKKSDKQETMKKIKSDKKSN